VAAALFAARPGTDRSKRQPHTTMLVLLSDIHITDGSTARNVHPSAFKLLGGDIEALAKKKRDNGQRLTELHVVLLGDILDLVRTDYWVRNVTNDERPWCGKGDPDTGMNADTAAMERHFGAVLDLTAGSESGQALVEMLDGLAELGLPQTKVTYVVGNHDRMFNNYPALKENVQRRFNKVAFDFASKVDEPDRYAVLARHGHEWDENCHAYEFYNEVLRPGAKAGRFDEWVYRVMALGEVVTAELMAGLVFYVKREFEERNWNSPEDLAFLGSFKDINNLRPMTAAFNWLAWFLRGQGEKYESYMQVMRAGLMDGLTSLLKCRFAKQWDKLKTDVFVAGDLTDHLGRALCLVKQKQGLKFLEGLASIVDALSGKSEGLDDLAKGAKEELLDGEAADDRYQYLFYGHTHEARHDCFRANQDDRVKLYVNTGTFLPFIERSLDGRGFYAAQRMTYAMMFNGDEDTDGRRGPGPTLDVWNGLRRKLTI
jgi:UDP-2,3-diacylglucosamine pyrophosphatase LpxH